MLEVTPVSTPPPAAPAPSVETLLLRFWSSLEERRGDRAALRRCGTPSDAVFVPAYHRLRLALETVEAHIPREALAVIAVVLAHVEMHESRRKCAAQMADHLSDLRFRRLLAIRTLPDLQVALVRVVQHLDGRANVLDLARAIRYWNDDTRKEWAFRYYDLAQKPKES